MTVRDFTQVFDSYAQFEELTLKKHMEEVGTDISVEDESDIELRYVGWYTIIIFSHYTN